VDESTDSGFETSWRQAVLLLREAERNCRTHRESLYRHLEFTTTAVTAIIATGLTIWFLGGSIVSDQPRLLTLGLLATVATLVNVLGIYSITQESFYTERARVIHHLLLRDVSATKMDGEKVRLTFPIDVYAEGLTLALRPRINRTSPGVEGVVPDASVDVFVDQTRSGASARRQLFRLIAPRALRPAGIRLIRIVTLSMLFATTGIIASVCFLLDLSSLDSPTEVYASFVVVGALIVVIDYVMIQLLPVMRGARKYGPIFLP
jgi:hypothetical protein